MSAPHRGPALPDLHRLFAGDAPLPEHAILPAESLPEPYRSLLVHDQHMTVTVEAFYNSLVDVVVLDRRHDGDRYARKILLRLQTDGRVVQSGIVRIELARCSDPVRTAILAERTPLGRILIEHNVMRRIEPTAFFCVRPGAHLRDWFSRPDPFETYGRLGIIHCDGQPAIELLEVLAPID